MGMQGLFWFGILLCAYFIIVSLRTYFRTGLKAQLYLGLSGLLLIPIWILYHLDSPAWVYKVLGVPGMAMFWICIIVGQQEHQEWQAIRRQSTFWQLTTGAVTRPIVRTCRKCHTKLEPTWQFCPFCGESIACKG